MKNIISYWKASKQLTQGEINALPLDHRHSWGIGLAIARPCFLFCLIGIIVSLFLTYYHPSSMHMDDILPMIILIVLTAVFGYQYISIKLKMGKWKLGKTQ